MSDVNISVRLESVILSKEVRTVAIHDYTVLLKLDVSFYALGIHKFLIVFNHLGAHQFNYALRMSLTVNAKNDKNQNDYLCDIRAIGYHDFEATKIMQEAFLKTIEKEDILDKSDKLLLAVSGGADSMVMATLFYQSGFNIELAHCNFNLRGEESDEDQQFVEDFAQQKDIVIHCKSFDTEAVAKAQGISIQQAARELRYAWFESLRKTTSCKWICTAHNKSDVAETMLINQLRGTGIEGLDGIPKVNGSVYRPLLAFAGDEIRNFAKANAIAYRNDSSNASSKYVRNAIRLNVIPELEKIEEHVIDRFAENAARVGEYNQLLDALIQQVSFHQVDSNGTITIPKNRLSTYPHQHLIVHKILDNHDFNRADLRQFIATSDVGSSLDSGNGKLFNGRDAWVFQQDRFILEEYDLSEGKHTFGNWYFEVKRLTMKPSEVSVSKNVAWIKGNANLSDYKLRSWQPSDRIKPLGMTGSKLVSDVLTDAKVPVHQRKQYPVLANHNDVVWVPQLSFNRDYAIDLNQPEIDVFEIRFTSTSA